MDGGYYLEMLILVIVLYVEVIISNVCGEMSGELKLVRFFGV